MSQTHIVNAIQLLLSHLGIHLHSHHRFRNPRPVRKNRHVHFHRPRGYLGMSMARFFNGHIYEHFFTTESGKTWFKIKQIKKYMLIR